MPINLTCSCGRALVLRDELGGKQIRCPECQAVLDVPKSEPLLAASEPLEVLPVAGASSPAKPTDDPLKDLDRLRSVGPRNRSDNPRTSVQGQKPNTGFGGINAGVGGGILMMIVAVVWFVVGLMNDWIFYYPPILFVLGLVAFIKGLVKGNETA